MTLSSRIDRSILGQWWWTIDRWLLAAILALSLLGVIIVAAASPAVAARTGYGDFHFLYRHMVFLTMALGVMVAVSMLTADDVLGLGFVVLVGALTLTAATLWLGTETKGAQRWLRVAGFSLQPSEFLKPAFAVVCAVWFAHARTDGSWWRYGLAGGLLLLVVGLLVSQPDIGMAVVICTIWAVQFFLAGMPLGLIGVLAVMGVLALVGAYFAYPHVASRIDRFLDPASGDRYQIDQALQAFQNGGLFGVGPGRGTVKENLPDSHADFIFAVAGEESGLIACLLVVTLIGFVVLRGFAGLQRAGDLFVLLAAAGLLAQFGVQALINLGSTLSLIPTKGMTLPFISYGGSSVLSLGLAMGMVLALTRRRADVESLPNAAASWRRGP